MLKITPKTPEQEALPRRLARTAPEHTLRGVPFLGVRQVLERHCNRDTADQVVAMAGLSADLALLSKYSLATFLNFEQLAVKALAESFDSYDEAIFACGAGAVHVFFATLAGRTMKALAGDNPHRLLSSVPDGYQLLASYGERCYSKNGPTSGQFTFRGELLGPVHTCGIFDAALKELYGVDVDFEFEQFSDVDFDFRLSWS